MQRRRLLKAALGGSALAVAGAGAGGLWLHGEPAAIATFPDIAAALAWIETIGHDPGAFSTTDWSLPQVFEHAAQSVEYSLDGYPALHSALFRTSVGPLAFSVFVRRGRMSHDTGEPIPGAPALVATDLGLAAQRLIQALQRFESHPAHAALAPHFAYGALDKNAYRRAHLMHLADHASEIVRTQATAVVRQAGTPVLATIPPCRSARTASNRT